ncbi:MAG: hypothetical protein PHO27_11250 [Sulfuricurvum sp.]|nr:hypothetical protein [Sulfuricurvum sp.]
MKKIVLAVLVTTGLMAADSGMYIGLDVGKANNTDKLTLTPGGSSNYSNNYTDLKLKLGGGTDGGMKFQGFISKIDYNEGVFITNESNSLYELGFDIIKEFEAAPSVYPFIKGGVSVGSMNSNVTVDGSVKESSFNLGAGLSYKAADHVYFIAGADYIYRRWSELRAINGTYTLQTTGSAVKPYIGINYKF